MLSLTREGHLENSVNKLLGKRANNLWHAMTLWLPLRKAFDELEAFPGEVVVSCILQPILILLPQEHTCNFARDPGIFFDSAKTRR
jgi:hypothetical protein